MYKKNSSCWLSNSIKRLSQNLTISRSLLFKIHKSTMKLRLRSLESKETQRIEVPNSCNLQQLKEIINLQLFPSSSSSSSSSSTLQQSLLLSLNRKDELFGDSTEESLQSLGVTSGDLVYYTLNPYAFSRNPNLLQTQIDKPSELNPRNDEDVNFVNTQMLECGKLGEFRDLRGAQISEPAKLSKFDGNSCDLVNTQGLETGKADEFIGSNDKNREMTDTQMEGMSKSSNSGDPSGDLVHGQMVGSSKLGEGGVASSALARELVDHKMEDPLALSNTDDRKYVEVTEGADDMEVDDESVGNVNTRFSVPGFLKKVFVKEVRDAAANGGNHKLLVIAVHAVLLESGFVGYDPVSGMKVDGFHLPDEWPSSAFGISLHYTLPEVSSSEVVETVVLKFQTLGKYVNVYGCLPKKGQGIHRVCLEEPRFVPALSYVLNDSDYIDSEKERDGSMKLYQNREIFDFWKIVKDGLSYPLIIELCEQVGLVPPPCFMLLPTELKLKILESLPGIDVAKVACVSSELHFVASNTDLWKLKYEEEFGKAAGSERECQWKSKFSFAWGIRQHIRLQWREPPRFRPLFPRRRYPNPLGLPFVIGGDYDRMPSFGILQPPGRRNFRRNCDLGGFDV